MLALKAGFFREGMSDTGTHFLCILSAQNTQMYGACIINLAFLWKYLFHLFTLVYTQPPDN